MAATAGNQRCQCPFDQDRWERLEQRIEAIGEALARLETHREYSGVFRADLETRLRVLETREGRQYAAVKLAVASAVVAAIVSAVAGILS